MPCKCGSTTHARTSHRDCPLHRGQGGPAVVFGAGDPLGFNPLSAWEERVEVPGLTLWQLHRPVWKPFSEAGTAKASDAGNKVTPVSTEGVGSVPSQGESNDVSEVSINLRDFSEFKASSWLFSNTSPAQLAFF